MLSDKNNSEITTCTSPWKPQYRQENLNKPSYSAPTSGKPNVIKEKLVNDSNLERI
jgi:hypothetical protein